MNNFTILVCLYEKDINTSDTLKSLISNQCFIRESNVYIWDNSLTHIVSDQLKFLKKTFKNLLYTHTPENLVLSKLYNKVINTLKDKNGYLLLLDDDSKLPKNFFQEISKQTKKNININLFLPKVSVGGVLVSPAKDYVYKTSLFKQINAGVIKSKYITAINSGMIISNRVFFDGFRYDERLRFYGTDNYFMYKYGLKYTSVFVLDTSIEHDLSFNTKSLERKVEIFKEIKRANIIIYSNNYFRKNILRINNFISAIKFNLKNNTLSFFKKYD